MIDFEIIYLCDSCRHLNKQYLGTPEYELFEYEFFTFNDAHNHMMKHPDHLMDTIIRKNYD